MAPLVGTPLGKTLGMSPSSSICHLRERPRTENTTALLAEDPFDDCYRVREGSFFYSSSISEDDAKSLTPSQVNRICDNVDTALTIPTFPRGTRVGPAPAPAPAPVQATPNSIQVDLSCLSVVILFLHADGSPKGLSFTSDDGRVRRVGDCRAEPGCVRVWHTPDLKFLAYSASDPAYDTRPPGPGYLRVWDIWFLDEVDPDQTAFPMTGTMTFRFPSTGLGIDLHPAHMSTEQDIRVSYPLADNPLYRYEKVTPDEPENIGDYTNRKKGSMCKRFVRRFAKERRRQKSNVRRAGSMVRRKIKQSFKVD
ncbi:hypothetical protein VMCG_03488 [Cytospora schulzeri]|uniref:Uncharacterized protein n=1 Tax=Cytospora schulzeri TaxID=448051 RepID=A0A423WWL6_9PEZI|nr:hypothetical protein VMCG_03488 [Valsa malicola]